jgi:hypothetical protein
MVLIATMVFFPVKCNAAGKNICQVLKESKTYHYNLDKKGKKESIKVDISRKRYAKKISEYVSDIRYDLKTTVTVNSKKIYVKTLKEQLQDFNFVNVMVTDVDKKDKQMELLIIEGDTGWTSNMEHIYYYQYINGKAKRKQDLVPLFKKNFKNVYSLHGGVGNKDFLTINGKNEIYARVCVIAQENQYDEDFMHIKAGLMLKKGKFVQLSSKSYELLDLSEDLIPIIVDKNLTAYTEMGGKKKAFTMKKGEKFSSGSRYCIKNKKIYLKVKGKKGQWGYIEFKKGMVHVGAFAHV